MTPSDSFLHHACSNGMNDFFLYDIERRIDGGFGRCNLSFKHEDF